eukprot:jgi/Ulvmu1/10855/UM007_0029.1
MLALVAICVPECMRMLAAASQLASFQRACSVLAFALTISFAASSIAAPQPLTTKPDYWKAAHVSGDLPLLPSSEHAPNSSSWRNSVAICATMKHENSTDVREWLLHYQQLGVEHVYLTENALQPTAHLRAQVDDFVQSGFLTYATDASDRAQLKVYYNCMLANHGKYNWLAFFDLDEFLLLGPGEQQRLPDFLDEYKQYPGLSVHWVLVGPSGRRNRPESGGVLRHYTQCAGKARRMVKTIANTFFLTNIATHPHNFEFRYGALPVNELGREIEPRYKSLCLPRGADTPDSGVRCYQDAGSMQPASSVAKVALFHYTTKSRADFAAKLERGSAMTHRGKNWLFFQRVARESTRSGGLCNLPAAAADKCCPPHSLVLAAA